MKNLSIKSSIFLLIACLSLTANAQVGKPRQDFSVGFSGGYTLNKVSFAPRTIKQMFKGGEQFGFATRYVCEKYYNSICAIQLELNYKNLGWQEDIDDNPAVGVINNQFTRNLSCFELPFFFQMGWGKERKGMKFLFEAGPFVQYFFHSSDKKYGEPWNPDARPGDVNYQYTHDIDNKISYGIGAGLGGELSTSVGHFIIGGRYYYGLGDMYDNSKKGYFARSANGTIEIRLTYLFDLIKTKFE